MKFNVRNISSYQSISVEFGDVKVDLGMFNDTERQHLCWELLSAVGEILPQKLGDDILKEVYELEEKLS